MRFLRPTAIIAAILIIAVSIPPSPLSQQAPATSQPKRPVPPKRQAKRPQRADTLALAINELLKLDPLPPQAPDEKDSDNADDSSEEQRKPPADDAPIKELIAYWRRYHGSNAPKPSDKVRQRLLEACEDRPELIIGLVNFLPETGDTHDLLYKLLEFEELKSFTSRQNVEDLGPEHYVCPPHRGCYKYLRLTKSGGRRIVLAGLRRAPKNPTLHQELSGLFYRLTRSGEFVTRYAIEDKIPGVEVLLADKKQEAVMVCGEGREIRVLTWQNGVGYKRAMVLPEWREFSSGAQGNVTGDPSACPMLGLFQSYM